MVDVAILIPAAGAARRMRGADKLLEVIDGEPLLRRQVRAALMTGSRVVVCLPLDRPGRAGALDGLAVTSVAVADAAEGMAASIRAGMAAVGDADGVMVALADMPDIGADDLAALIADFANHPDCVLRATGADGTPGHPVIFPRRLFLKMARISGDMGARSVLAGEAARLHALPGARALTDLDTPEAWAAWRAARGGV